jgi:hypothetical protein
LQLKHFAPKNSNFLKLPLSLQTVAYLANDLGGGGDIYCQLTNVKILLAYSIATYESTYINRYRAVRYFYLRC